MTMQTAVERASETITQVCAIIGLTPDIDTSHGEFIVTVEESRLTLSSGPAHLDDLLSPKKSYAILFRVESDDPDIDTLLLFETPSPLQAADCFVSCLYVEFFKDRRVTGYVVSGEEE